MKPRAGIGWEAGGPGRPVLAGGGRREPAPQKRLDRASPSFHDMVSRLATLERAPVFFSLREGTLRGLARHLRRVKVSAGEMILFQSEPGTPSSSSSAAAAGW